MYAAPMVADLRVAVVGIGVMGSSIAARLIDTGNEVVVFDVDQDRVAHLAERGAEAASSPAEATRMVDYVVLSLNTAEIVEAAVFGVDGIAAAGSADKLLIDMSSISPQATAEMAGRLDDLTGMGWSDNPLSGGTPAADKGALTIMAGGTVENFDRAGAVMAHLAANRTHMGPVGAGQATKLINQMLVGNGFATLMECAELANRSGVEPSKIAGALAGGRADSVILREFFLKMASRDYSPTGRIDNMLKDLNGAQQFARRAGVDTPLLDANVVLHQWLVANGHGGSDTAAMMEFFGPMESA